MYWLCRSLLILSAFIIILNIFSVSAEPPFELTGKIVFDHEFDIYTMNADGSERTQLTDHPDMDFDPVWSPDGSQIVFRSHRDGDAEIYVMDADGSNLTNLTQYANDDWSPAWSPDGTHIAFASMRPEGSGIWVMNADGSDPHRVATPLGVNDYPTWSPDSQQIAWNCTMGKYLEIRGQGDFEICVVNADGTGLIQITDTPGTNKFPSWSADGTQLVFVSTRDGWPTLPDYTPPGYDSENYGDEELWLMNPDGSNQRKLLDNPRQDDSFPAWSRDGMIVFTRYGDLMVISPESREAFQLTSTGADGFPDWFQPPS
jgi:Tol biopolymer transport system component